MSSFSISWSRVKQRSSSSKTQAEVKAKLSVAFAESQQLDVSRSGEYTVAEWLRVWFEFYAKPNIRPSAAGYYLRAMEEYTVPRIGSIKLCFSFLMVLIASPASLPKRLRDLTRIKPIFPLRQSLRSFR